MKGVEYFFNKNKIDVIFGVGCIVFLLCVDVMDLDGVVYVLEMCNIVIVIGLEVMFFFGIDVDEEWIVLFMGVFFFCYVL